MPKFIVEKTSDLQKVFELEPRLCEAYIEIGYEIEKIKKLEGRSTEPKKYIIVNQDEPYANEVIKILKENGHWD